MPTLSDIAQEVGVSNKTVSMTLRGKRCASEETTKRILEVAQRTGYVPNQAARMVRTQETPFIGLMADMVATTPHTVDLVRGAQTEAVDRGRTLLIGSMDGDKRPTEDVLRMFRAYRASGVIYATLFRHEVSKARTNGLENLVYANCFPADGVSRAILPDDEEGGYQQARHLLRLGHRHIAVITLPREAPATGLRLGGIYRALSEHGLQLEPEFCITGVEGYLPKGETYVAYERALDLLRRKHRPTAIICGNDRIALMTFGAAAHLGLRIPDDLSVIGFDDFQTISEFVRPRLTTIGLPYFEMGRRAVSALINDVDVDGLFEPVPCSLIERDSCAPLR